MYIKKLYLLLLISTTITASPSIEVGDTLSKLYINTLVSSDHLPVGMSTYPISISSLDNELKKIDITGLSKNELIAFTYLGKIIEESLKKFTLKVAMNLPSNKFGITNFDNDSRFGNNLYVQGGFTNKNFALNLEGYFLESPDKYSKKDFISENSYISFTKDNLIFSLGNQTMWWSPGSQNSLVVSNASFTPFGLSIKNKTPIKLKSIYLDFLNSYDFVFFIKKLESSRSIPNAKFFGAKLSFYPTKHFNFSIFRTAQWGGEGRPQDAKSFLNMLIGRENRGDSGININNDPGNQIAGIDLKFKFKILNKETIFFIHNAGEDEAGFLPAKNFQSYGLINIDNRKDVIIRHAVEFTDTFSGKKNYTYSHGVYTDGYNYFSRPLGAAIGADSNELSYSLQFNDLNTSHYWKLKLFDTELNQNSNDSYFISSTPILIKGIDLSYTLKLKNNKKFELYSHAHKLDKNIPGYDKNGIGISFSKQF